MAVGQYDWSTLVKLQLLYNFIISALYGMGTERHFNDIQRLMKKEVKLLISSKMMYTSSDIHVVDCCLLLLDRN